MRYWTHNWDDRIHAHRIDLGLLVLAVMLIIIGFVLL